MNKKIIFLMVGVAVFLVSINIVDSLMRDQEQSLFSDNIMMYINGLWLVSFGLSVAFFLGGSLMSIIYSIKKDDERKRVIRSHIWESLFGIVIFGVTWVMIILTAF
ncbi:hypothetical protein KKD19_00055 [Patescibacteria group bacterium]|nr:hypothetical protein [Patescibacteria group bacterium]